MKKVKSGGILSLLVVFGIILGLYGQSPEVSAMSSEELHGSCVYPIQKWHSDDFFKYCVPEIRGEYSPSGNFILVNELPEIMDTSYDVVPEIKKNKPADNPPVVISETPPQAVKEKTCKNPNAGKDGTPEECNAGGGQEKHKK